MRIFSLLALAACTYDEQLPEIDIKGKVVVPKEAVTRTVYEYTGVDSDGDGMQDLIEREEKDPRLMGPVLLGAYSGMDDRTFGYPHPAMGPIITSDFPGDTYPYGGTTIGRLDYACYEVLKCKVSTGRFTDYADVMDYFRNSMGYPVQDSDGNIIDEVSTFQQHCLELFEYTSDAELDFINPNELDFTETDDGFEAEFLMPHTQFVPGMVIWGWMDAPAVGGESPDYNGTYSTCSPSTGNLWEEYDQGYYWGGFDVLVLNYPSVYIFGGDWLADGQAVINAETDEPVVNLSVYVPQEEE